MNFASRKISLRAINFFHCYMEFYTYYSRIFSASTHVLAHTPTHAPFLSLEPRTSQHLCCNRVKVRTRKFHFVDTWTAVSIRDDTEDEEWERQMLLWGQGAAKGKNHPLYAINNPWHLSPNISQASLYYFVLPYYAVCFFTVWLDLEQHRDESVVTVTLCI
jgi:hypothetical protein